MQRLIKFSNDKFTVRAKNNNDDIVFDAETVAKSLGLTTIAKSGNACVRWQRVNSYLKLTGNNQVSKGSLITEQQAYKLAFKANNLLAEQFQDWLANDVLPTLRKTGKYETQEQLYEYFDKTYNGVPVLSTADISYFTGMNIATANYYLRTKAKRNVDYYYLEGESLKDYKVENPKASKLSSSLCLITKSGFIKLCKEYCVKIETPECFENKSKQLELKPVYKQKEVLKTLNLQQVDELFDKEAICIGDKNGVPVYRAVEIFGEEAVDFSRRLSDTKNKYGSKREASFNAYGIGENYALNYVTQKAFRIAATYHNINSIRMAGF